MLLYIHFPLNFDRFCLSIIQCLFIEKDYQTDKCESEAWVANYFITVTEPFLSYYCGMNTVYTEQMR